MEIEGPRRPRGCRRSTAVAEGVEPAFVPSRRQKCRRQNLEVAAHFPCGDIGPMAVACVAWGARCRTRNFGAAQGER